MLTIGPARMHIEGMEFSRFRKTLRSGYAFVSPALCPGILPWIHLRVVMFSFITLGLLMTLQSAGADAVGLSPVEGSVVRPLWDAAVKRGALGMALQPETVDYRFLELTPEGKTLTSQSGSTERDSGGILRLVRAEKNGVNILGKPDTPSAFDPTQARKGPMKGLDATPFDPKLQQDLTIVSTRVSPSVIEVEYAIRNRDIDLKGTVTFDPRDGRPVDAQQRHYKLPPFVSYLRLSLRFGMASEALVVKGIDTEVKVDALVYRRLLRYSFEFPRWP